MPDGDGSAPSTRAASIVVKIVLGVVVVLFAVGLIAAFASKSDVSPASDPHDVRSYPCHDPYATHQTTLYVDFTARTWRSEDGAVHSIDGTEERQLFETFVQVCAPNPLPTGY